MSEIYEGRTGSPPACEPRSCIGFLFSALIVIPYTLSSPGVFASVLAGLQTAPMLRILSTFVLDVPGARMGQALRVFG
jgi:hypothetical protein